MPDESFQIPSVPRYFIPPISGHFRKCSFHNEKCLKNMGNMFVASLIAKNRKISCENSTTGNSR